VKLVNIRELVDKNMFQFLSEVKTELMKVVWPTRSQTTQYTVTVIVFSVAMAIVLGLSDLGLITLFEKLVK